MRRYLHGLRVNYRTAMELRSDEAVKAAMQYGYGFAMPSKYSVRDELRSGILKAITLQAPRCVRQLYLVRDPARRVSETQESFMRQVLASSGNPSVAKLG